MNGKTKAVIELGLVCCLFFCSKIHASAEDQAGWQPIFNGQDSTGWDGNPRLWSIKDGTIVGQTTPENPANGNNFCIQNLDF